MIEGTNCKGEKMSFWGYEPHTYMIKSQNKLLLKPGEIIQFFVMLYF